jgi:hypothetical protein
MSLTAKVTLETLAVFDGKKETSRASPPLPRSWRSCHCLGRRLRHGSRLADDEREGLACALSADRRGRLGDRRAGQQGSTRRLLELNTAISVAAAVALGFAGSGDKGDVFAVFGVWALVTGGLQLAVAIRRRKVFGWQWRLLLAGAGSTLFGIAFLAMAGADNPPLRMIAAYAFGGGLEFVSRPGCSRAGHLGPSRRPRVVGITVAVAASRAYGHCITRRAVVRVRRDLRRGLQRGHSKVLGGLAAGEHGDVV